jgi:hypothetical protein
MVLTTWYFHYKKKEMNLRKSPSPFFLPEPFHAQLDDDVPLEKETCVEGS